MKKLSEVAVKIRQALTRRVETKFNCHVAVDGLEPKTEDVVIVDRNVITFLMTKYAQSLGGFETPAYRAARIGREVSDMNSHDEIQAYVELESMSASVQEFLRIDE